jgi:hypothetical protein
MKTIYRFKFWIIAIVIATATFQTSIQAQEAEGGGRLAGTWDAVVTITVCATGAPIVSFLSTANFNQGGTFSGITSGTSPSLRTSERGVWSHVSGNLYRFRFKAYVFNAAGVATSYQVITHDVELDKDNLNYTSAGTTQVFAMDGTPIGSGCSTAVGTRMTLD